MRILLQFALCLAVAGTPALAQRGGGHGGGMGGGGFHGGGMGGGFRGGMGMGGGFRGGGMGMGGFRGGGMGMGGFRGRFNNGFNRRFNNNFFFRRNFNRAFSSIFFNGAFVPGFGGFGGSLPSYGLSYYPFDYGYPYGGDYYGYPDYGYPDMAASPAQTSPNVTVIYPPSQPANTALYVQPAHPVIREYDQYGQEIAPSGPWSANTADAARSAPSGSPVYLFAFKDNVIRAAAAYWVDGHVLHYVTIDHEERQVPLADVDRTLTQRLNGERHVTVQLP